MSNPDKPKYLCGEIYVDVTVSPGVDGATELQKVDAVSFSIGGGKENVHLELDGFKNYAGLTIADILSMMPEKICSLVDKQDREEQEEAERTRAEDLYYSEKNP